MFQIQNWLNIASKIGSASEMNTVFHIGAYVGKDKVNVLRG